MDKPIILRSQLLTDDHQNIIRIFLFDLLIRSAEHRILLFRCHNRLADTSLVAHRQSSVIVILHCGLIFFDSFKALYRSYRIGFQM
jgi:hypothetical protein